MSASTQDTPKVAEMENPVEAFRRIIENLEVLFPNLPISPIDQYDELFGQLKSKLVGVDLFQAVRDDPPSYCLKFNGYC